MRARRNKCDKCDKPYNHLSISEQGVVRLCRDCYWNVDKLPPMEKLQKQANEDEPTVFFWCASEEGKR